MKAPVQVIVLRALAFLACTFLLTLALCGTSNPFAPEATLPPALPPGGNGSAAPDNSTAPGAEGWQQLLGLLPEHAAEKLREAWAFGKSHQMGVVALGLLTCLLAMLLAGRIRCVWSQAGRDWVGGKVPGVEARRLCWARSLGEAPWCGWNKTWSLFSGSWESGGCGARGKQWPAQGVVALRAGLPLTAVSFGHMACFLSPQAPHLPSWGDDAHPAVWLLGDQVGPFSPVHLENVLSGVRIISGALRKGP